MNNSVIAQAKYNWPQDRFKATLQIDTIHHRWDITQRGDL